MPAETTSFEEWEAEMLKSWRFRFWCAVYEPWYQWTRFWHWLKRRRQPRQATLEAELAAWDQLSDEVWIATPEARPPRCDLRWNYPIIERDSSAVTNKPDSCTAHNSGYVA